MKKITKNILVYTGLTIVGASHVWMLWMGMPANMMTGHAIINLVAGTLIGIAYFKE